MKSTGGRLRGWEKAKCLGGNHWDWIKHFYICENKIDNIYSTEFRETKQWGVLGLALWCPGFPLRGLEKITVTFQRYVLLAAKR